MRRFIMLTIALMLVAGSALAADQPVLVPDEQTYYLHWDDCGADIHTYLSVVEPSGLNDCGFIGGTPVSTPFTLLEEPFVDSYPAEDGLPVLLDGSGTVDGEVAVHSWTGLTGAGVGSVWVDVELTGMVGTQFVNLGYFEGEAFATPEDDYASVEFSFDVDDALDERTLSSLNLNVNVWGFYIDSGTQTAGGLSWLTLPILVEADEDGDDGFATD